MHVFLATCAALVVAAFAAHTNVTEKHCVGLCQQPALHSRMAEVMRIKEIEHDICLLENKCPLKTVAPMRNVPCKSSYAGEYQCENIDLAAFLPLSELGSEGDGNDIWGWTDPSSKREYAIVGTVDGTSFVDVTTPTKPIVLGFLATHTVASLWRDIKVYKDHAFIVSEAPDHGMQVVDLTQFRGRNQIEPVVVAAHYSEFGSAHNMVINEDSGYGYAVGTKTCRGGLHMIDLHDPRKPVFAGCFDQDGYTHDAQCVIYHGPDSQYYGKEICFAYNEDTLTIVDVTKKDAPVMISRETYDGVQYTHQGWLFNDQANVMLNDELDEMVGPNKHTRSLMWNVTDLEKPVLVSSFYSSQTAIDHNLYIHKGYAWESNYCAGLRVLDMSRAPDHVEEVGYFDVAPDCTDATFHGSWSSYPYFPSGTVVVSSIERGLFVLTPTFI